MSDFRELTPAFWASQQIEAADLAEARQRGCVLVINNRPDGESEDQPEGKAIEDAARDAGMGYVAIPVSHAGFSDAQVVAMEEALSSATGPVLAYCRSGTRSTFLWALAQARAGQDPAWIAESARRGGYDISPIAPLIARYASNTQS